jgi:hypothetical protein
LDPDAPGLQLQSVRRADPRVELEYAGHALHSPAPSNSLYSPGRHNTHGPEAEFHKSTANDHCTSKSGDISVHTGNSGPEAPELQKQFMTSTFSSKEFVFGGHGVHAVSPSSEYAPYVPTGHTTQEIGSIAAVVVEYLPTSHGQQGADRPVV